MSYTLDLPDKYSCKVFGCKNLGTIRFELGLLCSEHAVAKLNVDGCDYMATSTHELLHSEGEISHCAADAPDVLPLTKRGTSRCSWDPTCTNKITHTRKFGTRVGSFCFKHFLDDVKANPTRPCDACGKKDTPFLLNEALCLACFQKKYRDSKPAEQKSNQPGRPKQRTIALDFDGVLHRYQGYKNGRIDGPIAGARAAVKRMLERGHKVVVFSTRDSAMIVDWLAKYHFPKLTVTATKSPFWVIVDDRAVTFDGAWTQDFEQRIEDFAPYWLGTAPAEGETPWPEDDTSTFDVRL